jgi:hypothetical protein
VANLGFQTHKLELAGLPMKVIAQDAKPLVAGREDYLTGTARADISYVSNTINVPPGRSFDVLITLPAVSAITDFPMFDRNIATNGGADGAGAMRSAVRVYPNGLAPQTAPNL